MIVKYGGFAFEDNEAMVSFYGAVRIYNQRGRPQFLRKRMVITGEIVRATTALLDARAAQINAAFEVDGGRLVLCTSAGAETDFRLGTQSLTGVRIVQPPTYQMEDGKAHFATGLPFSIVAEADYTISDGDPLISYSESITYIGSGGPRKVMVELDQGLPIEQVVSTNTPVTIIQSGEAVGYASYPSINGAIYPPDQPDGEQVTRGAPRLEGNAYIEYPVRWAYRMTLNHLPSIPNPIVR